MTGRDAQGEAVAQPVIWMRTLGGTRGPQPSLTLERIAAAAVELADEDGLEAVSTRRLAAKLGVGAASLYRYVTGKLDLYDLMVDRVCAEYELAPTGDWRSDVHLYCVQALGIHRRHPWLGPLMNQVTWGPHLLSALDFLLGALPSASFDLRRRMEILGLVNGMTALVASTIAPAGPESRNPERVAGNAVYLASVAAEPGLPHLSEALRQLAEAPPAPVEPEEVLRTAIDRLLGVPDAS